MSNDLNTETEIRQLLSDVTLNPGFLSASADERIGLMGLDSVGMIELIYDLERRFGIRLSDQEVVPENFQSIRTLTSLIERKHATA